MDDTPDADSKRDVYTDSVGFVDGLDRADIGYAVRAVGFDGPPAEDVVREVGEHRFDLADVRSLELESLIFPFDDGASRRADIECSVDVDRAVSPHKVGPVVTRRVETRGNRPSNCLEKREEGTGVFVHAVECRIWFGGHAGNGDRVSPQEKTDRVQRVDTDVDQRTATGQVRIESQTMVHNGRIAGSNCIR